MIQRLHDPLPMVMIGIALICFSAVSRADGWTEQGDAGSLRGSAQIPVGTGALDSIDGVISSNNDVDVYLIFLTGGKTFSASTHNSDGGDAGFDSMLFLFDADGYGIYYDDDIDMTYLAQLPAQHALTPYTPGYYYLVISSWENDAQSSSGQIFPIDDDVYHVQGPQQPGAANPWIGWDNEGQDAGSYHIVLTGAEFGEIDQTHPIDPSMSASWYYTRESGHGVMINVLDETTAWMCWFTFDLDGNRAWICSLGTIDDGTITFEDAFMMEGGNFPPLWDPEQVAKVPWGTIIITFTSCDSARMEWATMAPGFMSGSMPLSRLTNLWGNVCE